MAQCSKRVHDPHAFTGRLCENEPLTGTEFCQVHSPEATVKREQKQESAWRKKQDAYNVLHKLIRDAQETDRKVLSGFNIILRGR